MATVDDVLRDYSDEYDVTLFSADGAELDVYDGKNSILVYWLDLPVSAVYEFPACDYDDVPRISVYVVPTYAQAWRMRDERGPF